LTRKTRTGISVFSVVLGAGALGCAERPPEEPIATNREPLAWAGRVRIAPDSRLAEGEFGVASDVDGTTAIVGAPASAYGAAHVFVRNGAVWSEQALLQPSDLQLTSYFGLDVAVSGDLAVVAAPFRSSVTGAAYVFERSGGRWMERQILEPPQSVPSHFAGVVDIDGTTLVATSTGRADQGVFVFVRNGASFVLEQQIVIVPNPADLAWASVSLDGDTLAVGAITLGTVQVFTRSGSTWSEAPALTPSDGSGAGAYFGNSVSVSGDWIAVGAQYSGTSPSSDGAVYLYQRSGATFVERQKLRASDPVPSLNLGGPVSLSGDRLAAGAAGDDNYRGAVYLFESDGSTFGEIQKLTHEGSSTGNVFGNPALDDRTLFAGTTYEDRARGAAYVYRWGAANGEACTLADDCSSLFCVEGVCCDMACDAACTSCLGARKTSGADGTCGVVPEGEDAKNACAAEPARSCGTVGACDGAGECALHARGTICDPASCPTARSEDRQDTCDGAGSCDAASLRDCEVGYLCVEGFCRTSCAGDSDCDVEQGFACIDEVCRVPGGRPCEVAADCETGHCADGVCCDAACAGQCESCAEAGREGECLAVTGEPRGDREACPTGGDPGCESRCDGSEREECRYVPANEACASQCEDGNEIVDRCDGEGACLTGEPRACSPYRCGDTACLGECEVGDDCDPGYRCEDSECVPGARCSAEGTSSIGADAVTSCGQYRCDEASGECRRSCASTAQDCAPGYVCNPDSAACERAPEDPEDSGGCGCRLAAASGAQPARGLAGLVVALALLGVRRRRRFNRTSGSARPSVRPRNPEAR
jgi:MYXO-CTERM domain-containing protein